jgi:hypothetical protein
VIVLFIVMLNLSLLWVHLVLPVVGILTMAAVITQMSKIGLTVGCTWLALGAAVAVALRVRSGKANGARVRESNA